MTYTLTTACHRVFARHETFHARYGWFRKAVIGAQENPDLFTAEDATVSLGVGKNMVRAIRFWGGAAKVIAEAASPGKRRNSAVRPTLNGEAVFGVDGVDPYMEAPGTLWLLHWWLLRPPCELPVWWIAFNRFSSVEFTEEDLVRVVNEEILRHGWVMPNESSIRKDISCLLRTYAAADHGRASLDDLLDSPLRGLGLIERSRAAGRSAGGGAPGAGYRFLLGAKPSLPPEIIAFAMLDWMARIGAARTVSMANAVFEPGSPGKVFGLSERALNDAMTRVVDTYAIGQLLTTAGATQFVVMASESLPELAQSLLTRYYENLRMKLSRPLGDGPASYNDAALVSLSAAGGAK
ncbi:DUF4007 family protein [Micromonospora sp. DR5-3]|uniref:DUF4007 family protein n=1 Tax=unclassified Micromonospora TaxID=2617518 RepID=UPI001652B52E|nr:MULTISPECIES: DUF4007 family protein [unclassified Micromonospora]MCW3817839.1 DUF4007 family protein [Micromonospora sp. DR5-3]